MDAERWKKIERLLHAALEVEESQRADFVESACGADGSLRHEVTSLLAKAGTDSFLAGSALEAAAKAIAMSGEERLTALPESTSTETVIRSSSHGFAVGQMLGPYQVEATLGAGGMGTVYRGRDRRLGRAVAIKQADKEFTDRFLIEARAVAALSHPHVCTLYDVGPNYLVMELAEGETLARRLRNAPLPLPLITQYGIEIADALDAAHSQGIIHCDLKPGNIMITKTGTKVLDFGLAKLLAPVAASEMSAPITIQKHVSRAGLIAGTPAYMSPEQALGKELDARTDLFSFGALLYEMATGRAPFHGKTTAAVLSAVVHGTPQAPSQLNSQLPPNLEQIIQKALEKDREVRYQHASELRADLRRLKRDAESSPGSVPVQTSRRRPLLLVAVAGFVLAILAAGLWLTRPLPPPHARAITQITRDGQRKYRYVTDGLRLYYSSGHAQDTKFFQMSAYGGEPFPMPQLDGLTPMDISPDHSELLLEQFTASPYPLWVANALGGRPRRLGNLSSAGDACWSPQGDQIVYTGGAELRLARSDGTELRKLATVPGIPHAPSWSPDGRKIRFTLTTGNTSSLWEVSVDGSHLHPVILEWKDRPSGCCLESSGVWTPDQRYFLFSARQASWDVWAVRERPRRFEIRSGAPIRLTTGPLQVSGPIYSPDGKRIFFFGTIDRGELVRYNQNSRQWMPYLSGLAAMHLDYSPDSNWLTYVSYPDASVWRSASDGSQRVQLTAPPLEAYSPRWSPDGTQIAFPGRLPGKPWRVYTVPAAGGAIRALTNGESGARGDIDPGWSPDGASLVFSTKIEAWDPPETVVLRTVDVRNGRISTLPGSQGLWSPRWSPDGRYIAALGFPKWKVMLYDIATHKQTELADLVAGWPTWSRDSHFVYFRDEPTTAWYRVSIQGRKLERVYQLEAFRPAPTEPSYNWIGLTPDGSLIAIRDAGSTEIYGLDWETP